MSSPPVFHSTVSNRSFVLLSFATFSSSASQRICDAMLPELAREFDVGLAQAAQVVSVFAVVYGVLQLFYGPLGDRLGKFRIVAWATLGCSVGSLVAAFSSSLEMLLFSRVLVAMAAAAIVPLTLAWIGDVADPQKLHESIARVGMGTTLGIAGGQVVGGILTDTFGWRWAFAMLALLFCVVGGLLLADWRRQLAAAALRAAGTPAPPTQLGFARQALRILALPWPRTLLVVGVVEGAAGFGVLAIWASHLHAQMGFSLSAAGGIVALFGVGGVAYMASTRRMIARLGQARIAALGGCLVLLASLVVAFPPDRWWSIPASLLMGFGFFGFHNVMQANAAQMAPASRGTGVSLFAASLFAGQSLGVLLAASLLERVGSGVVIATGGLVLALLGCGFAWLLHRRAAVPTPSP